MQEQQLLEQLLGISKPDSLDEFLKLNAGGLTDSLAKSLKLEADTQLRSDINESRRVSMLLERMAKVSGSPRHKALGLLAEANALSIGMGEYENAIGMYDEAAALYELEGLEIERARSQIGKIGALSHLGMVDEAVEAGNWATEVFERNEAWEPLAVLTMNMAILYSRIGEDNKAIDLLDRAADLFTKVGPEGDAGWVWVQHNRAVALRNLGEFDTSIQAITLARERLLELGQRIEAARAEQALALTLVSIGDLNEALRHLDQAREEFLSDERHRDAMLIDLYASDCLLQLGRYADALEKCRSLRSYFRKRGAEHVVGQAYLNEAIALERLERFDEAVNALTGAQEIFEDEGSQAWVAFCQLETAALMNSAHAFSEGRRLALDCAREFRDLGLEVEVARANLIASKAAGNLNDPDRSAELARMVVSSKEAGQIPPLIFEANMLLGKLEMAGGDHEAAEAFFLKSIEVLERLRGTLMVEFRPSFVQDKAQIYESMVELNIARGRPSDALEFVERAKSRALRDLIAFRVNLALEPRAEEDIPLVRELLGLRDERDRLYRHWESSEQRTVRGPISYDDRRESVQQEVHQLETRITDLWHQLLVRNADYARNADLWTVVIEPIQPYLDAKTAMLEYFVANGRILCFLVTTGGVDCLQVEEPYEAIARKVRLFQLNLESLALSRPASSHNSLANVNSLLRDLFQSLMKPTVGQLADYERLIVVPHGDLHYLPFHALYDGRRYLMESHEVSYLPAGSLLKHCKESAPGGSGTLSVGNSQDGRLPFVIEEARSIAARTGADALIEGDASRSAVLEAIPRYRTVHIAAHGEFRSDNPLFSGIALSDGWLTTLDLFNSQLDASLAVLSACQTGKAEVGGGDELLGLSRAFLYAGSASLVLSLWSVEDRSTAILMDRFYEELTLGNTKSASLRNSAVSLLEGARNADDLDTREYVHPYYWAPFTLVGDPGAL